MHYAIIQSGGKQYKAIPGDVIDVDHLPDKEGKNITLKQVLLVANDDEILVGTPTVKGASVKAKVLEHYRGRKILVFKYIPRENYRRRKGHRQTYTRLQINKITVKSKE
ncbi:MAG: 50S ribosomal protein L21 [Anaerolineales bacterium]|nr:50S ribosomal protein L21 [Anaerolineales bacterium]HEY62158.1 50S ribosomal protein L21 [Anaerolineae bacterium]